MSAQSTNATGGSRDSIPSGGERLLAIAEFVRELFTLLPPRQSCTREKAGLVVECWTKHRHKLYGPVTIDQALADLRADLSTVGFPELPSVGPAEVGCLLAEALHLRGQRDDAVAFFDWAVDRSRQSARESTRQRLETLRESVLSGRDGHNLTEREASVLCQLPAAKYGEIAEELELGEDSIKACMAQLKKSGLVEGDRTSGYRRTEFGEEALAAHKAREG